MAKGIDEFRLKLVSKIRQADSERSIARYIETAVKTMARKKVNGHLIVRFLDRSIVDLQADDNTTDYQTQEKSIVGLKLLRLARTQMTDRVN